jgi:hypothetical protein
MLQQGAHEPKGYESRVVEFQGAVAAQLEDWARIVQDVLQMVAALPLDHPMIMIWQDPAWLHCASDTFQGPFQGICSWTLVQ